jgi:hypothetical protein
MLEQLAIHEYGAKTLAVDTRAYEIPWASEGESSYLKKWYERRGYVEYRVSCISQQGHNPPSLGQSSD